MTIQEKYDEKLNSKRKKFGNRLRELRINAGYKSRSQFADAIGYAQESIKKWETGNGFPSMDTLMLLCDEFNCELDYLLGNMEYRTHDEKFICEETGLSPEAVQCLKEWKTRSYSRAYLFQYSQIINDLILDHATREGNKIGTLENDTVLNRLMRFLRVTSISTISGYGHAYLNVDMNGNKYDYNNRLVGIGHVVIDGDSEEGVFIEAFPYKNAPMPKLFEEQPFDRYPSDYIQLTDKLLERSLLDQLDDSLKRLKKELHEKELLEKESREKELLKKELLAGMITEEEVLEYEEEE